MSINAWGSNDPAEVAKGGTGAATLTDHGVLLGSGTSPVTVTAVATNGQLLIGSTGADPAVAAPTGDANEIAIGTGAGTLSVGIADDPVFPGNASVTITTGTTAQEPAATNGRLRYDTDTDKLRGVENSAWVDLVTGVVGSGSLVYLTSTAITSSTASATFDNTYINTYESFYFVVHAVPISDSLFQVQISNDNGSTYHTSGYNTSGGDGSTSTMLASAYTDSIFTPGRSAAVTITTAGRGMYATFTLNNMLSSSLFVSATGTAFLNQVTNIPTTALSGGQYVTAETNDAVKILFDSGNIATAEIHLYGIKTT